MKKSLTICFVLLAMLPMLAFAHEGHGHTEGYTITHYFTEPLHLAVTLTIVALSGILIWRRMAKNRKKPA